jgi:hypothetical protein
MIVDKLDNAMLFDDPSHLLTAFDIVCGDRPYPAKVLFVPDRGWAAAASSLCSAAELKRLALQHGWKLELPEAAIAGQWVPMQSVISGEWTYRDPSKAMEWAGGTAMPIPAMASWAFLDPTTPHMQFILGATDECGAQRILDALSARFAQGISAVPVLLDPVGESVGPFRFFWRAFLERPNPFLFEAAEQVWWGPLPNNGEATTTPAAQPREHGAERRSIQIFLEYPWRPPIETRRLHKMPWRSDAGIALVSRSEPAVIELRYAPEGSAFFEYLGVVKLAKGQSRVSLPAVLSQGITDARFKVDIRLAEPDPRRAEQIRIRELQDDIAAKQKILEHLESIGHHGAADDAGPQPLFLYAQRETGKIPPEIQRLVIEWSDQPEDIGAIRYAALHADDLPPPLFQPGTTLHVITAAATLGSQPGSFDVAARLLDYKPSSINSWTLMLDQEWADCNLRLFAPSTGHIWLYPNLRPSAFAAASLAAAIHSNPHVNRDEWLYLALPGRDKDLQFLLLRKDAFAPLSKAFEGMLDIDVSLSTPRVSEALQGKTRAAVLKTIDSRLTNAVAQEAKSRLDKVTGRLKDEAKSLADDLEKRTKRMNDAKDLLAELDEALRDIGGTLNDAVNLSTEVARQLRNLGGRLQASADHVQSLHALIGRHRKLRQRVDAEIAATRRIRTQWMQSKKM